MVSTRQNSLSSFLRDAWVEVDLAAIEHNVRIVKSWIAVSSGDCKLMAVVKSDAYGHGAPSVAEVLTASGATHLGVASVDEGLQLRTAGIDCPVLILAPTPFWAVENAIQNGLDLTVTSEKQIEAIDTACRKLSRVASVHLKVDTGMHRLGAAPEKALDLLAGIARYKTIELASIFSHLARAGDAEATGEQKRRYDEIIQSSSAGSDRGLIYHLASSEATRSFPDTHYDMVRVGLYLYGLEPTTVSTELRPAMTVRGRIFHIGMVPEGEAAGYNGTWKAGRPARVASIPVGYADGVDRRLSNNMNGLLQGRIVEQVGLISMDQMMFDVTDVPEAQEGDVITLIGSEDTRGRAADQTDKKTLYLADWANKLDTITYELACRLRARLPRIYTRHRKKGMTGEPGEERTGSTAGTRVVKTPGNQ